MERDFMGLNSKETLAVVKEEITNDGCKDIGFTKASGMQFPFSNKVSALSHLMSFKVAPDGKAQKMVSSGLMSISTADADDSALKRSVPDIQKSFNHDRQGGTHFSLTAYPLQHDVHSVHHPYDVKVFPVHNQPMSISMSNPFFKNHLPTRGSNLTGGTMKRQLLGGIHVTTPHSIVQTAGSIGTVTEPGVKSSGSSVQLSIFYGGMVNVYDDITPEKARAIMFLAGNGSPHPKPEVKQAANDSTPASQPLHSPCSGLPSPLSVSSHSGFQSGSGSTSTDELLIAKTNGPVSKMDAPKIVDTAGSIVATTIMPSAVPQARKASLARFLEKRKERVMSAAPYNLNLKSSESAA